MGKSGSQSKLFSFYKTVITVLAFAACFYLLIVCFAGTYRLISDIGYARVMFLNPLLLLFVAVAAVFACGVLILKSPSAMGKISLLDEQETFDRAMRLMKILVFAECMIFAVGIFGMGQREDQLEVQRAAYSFSWGEKETFTPPGYLGIYPNNTGMAVVLYLISGIAGHYNNALIMLINAMLVPFIYSDLAEIGGRFGLSRKSQIMVMAAGLLFLPFQAKVLIIYGDIPGMFFAVRAMKHAAAIAEKKVGIKSIAVAVSFAAIACVIKNNFIIFSIAVTIYLAAELLKQRRFKDLYIPVAVLAASVLLNSGLNLIVGAVAGTPVSSGASKYSWIAMGMQEEAGMYNGYNALTYAESGFDASVQAVSAKQDIAASIQMFFAEPQYAIGFYTRKILIQWSDPTHCAFEFFSRNAYLDSNASPFVWFLADPSVIRISASFLKVFQILMFLGGASFAVKSARSRNGSPALLLFLTFIGGYVFHLIWEAAPFYTLSYMTVMIPAGVAGLTALIKKMSKIDLKAAAKAKMTVSASAMVFFIAGVFVFLLAAAGLGTLRQLLVEGKNEYKAYYSEVLPRTRNPVSEGRYYLKPAAGGFEGDGLLVEISNYAGKYRMRVINDDLSDDIFLTVSDGSVKIDWFSYDDSQVFVLLENRNGTYSICHGQSRALVSDAEQGGIKAGDFIEYTFLFDTEGYDEFIEEHPETTWNLVPAT